MPGKHHYAHTLETWYLRHARALPWRRSHDPYLIWISEVMLQQTQVTTVIPYFEAFLSRFPSARHLAEAAEEDVLLAWSGLGYYSRARNLHRGAKYLVNTLAEKFPRTREEILLIPGIGPYTAGAILSIAFDLPEPLVDGNVQRVFARYFACDLDVKSTSAQRLFWEKAREWVTSAKSPRVLNQALMELGATICIKGSPRCERCPLQKGCLAKAQGRQFELPVKMKRRAPQNLWWVGLVFHHDDKYFLRKNLTGEWWSDLWDFPREELDSETAWRQPRKKPGWRSLDLQRHTVTHHRIHMAPYLIELRHPRVPKGLQGQWFSRQELKRLPLSSLAKKIMHATI